MEEPLAFKLKEALEQENQKMRALMFRHLGDVSLYKAGFFQDSLNKKIVDLDYYIEMGETAYHQVAKTETSKSELYSELSDKFARFVDVFAEISDESNVQTEKDLLRVYKSWSETKNLRQERVLKKAGILTETQNSPSKKKKLN